MRRSSDSRGRHGRARTIALVMGLASLAALSDREDPVSARGTVEGYKSPIRMVMAPGGEQLYVVCEESDEIIRVDVAGRRLSGRVDVGRSPFDAVLSPDGALLYVSNRLDDDVTVVDVQQMRVIRRFATGDNPHGLALDSDGRFLYVANSSSDDLSVIATSDYTEVKRLSAGRFPFAISSAPDGRHLYVSSVMSNKGPHLSPPTTELTIIDTDKQQVVDRRALPGTVVPQGLTVTPDGQLVIVVVEFPKNLVPETQIYQGWMVTSGLVIAESKPGGAVAYLLIDEPQRYYADPFDVITSPDGRFLYVSSSGSNTVTVIDVEQVRGIFDIRQGRIGVDGDQLGLLARDLGASSR